MTSDAITFEVTDDLTRLPESIEIVSTSFGNLLSTQLAKDPSRMISEEREWWEHRIKRIAKFAEEYKIKHWMAFARDSKKVVGFAFWKYSTETKIAVDMFCVDEGHRKQGIGRKLMEIVTTSDPKVERTRLCTALYNNETAIAFYKKIGFVGVVRDDCYVKFVKTKGMN